MKSDDIKKMCDKNLVSMVNHCFLTLQQTHNELYTILHTNNPDYVVLILEKSEYSKMSFRADIYIPEKEILE
jgi:hypothetical protein